MDVIISEKNSTTIVALAGEIDGRTAPVIQEKLTPLIAPDCKILLDMQRVTYMSSAGLRLMLLFYRKVASQNGRVVLVGLSEMVRDTMAITGFLDFFETYATAEKGLAVLDSGG